MGKRRVFTKEFKEEACKLVIEEKQKISETARDLGIGQGMLGQWVKASRHANSNPEADSERQRVKELESECRRLKMERDILKKAIAYFSEVPR